MSLKKNQIDEAIPVDNKGGFLFIPALFTGITSGCSFFSFANILVLFIVLAITSKGKKQLFSYGSAFIVSVLLTKFILVTGFFYEYLGHPVAFKIYSYLYVGISFVFLALGLVHFIDWLRSKNIDGTRKMFAKLPAYFDAKSSFSEVESLGQFRGIDKDKEKKGFVVLSIFFLGIILTASESLWPQDYLFFAENYLLIYKYKVPVIALTQYLFFTIGFISPLVIICMAAKFLFTKKTYCKWVVTHMSVYKILLSTIYISSGIILLKLSVHFSI